MIGLEGRRTEPWQPRTAWSQARQRMGPPLFWHVSKRVIAASGLVLGVIFPVMAQQAPVFRADAELTVLRVGVVQNGEPVLGLGAEDFRVFEEGEERPISVFIAPEWEPLEVILAMDFSGSMLAWPARQAADVFLNSLHPGSCVLFLPFRTTPSPGVWGHPNDAELRRLATEAEFFGDEGIYDALVASFVLMRNRGLSLVAGSSAGAVDDAFTGELIRFRNLPRDSESWEIPEPRGECAPRENAWSLPTPSLRARQAVVVITDGHDHASRSNLDDVLLVAWGSGLPVFFLVGEGSGRYGPGHYGTMRKLSQLLEYTGGALFRAPQRDDVRLWNELQRMIAGLRAQYVLGFVPADSNGSGTAVLDRRRIEVTVRGGEYDVLAPEHIIGGQVASGTAAIDLIYGGFRQIATGRLNDALHAFDAAAAIALRTPSHMGAIHYGRGIALARLGRSAEALQELRQAANDAPWLPDLGARQAELLLELGDHEAAWEHAVRGHLSGSDVGAVVERLQAAAPRPKLIMSSARPGGLVRVAVQARANGDAALQGIAVPAVLSAVAQALAAMPNVVVASRPSVTEDRPGLTLLVEVDRIRERDGRVEARAKLILRTDDNKKVTEAPLHLSNVASTDEVSLAVARAMPHVQAAIDQLSSSEP